MRTKDMLFLGVMPAGPAQAEEDTTRRITEGTGPGEDIHLHEERRAEQIAKKMTDDTRAGGDMALHT